MIHKKSYLMILILMILSLLVITIIPSYSMAATSINPDDYDPSKSTVDIGQTTIKDKANIIIGIIKAVGTVISVITLIVLGIKFMTGSVEEKAEYKKTMIPYLIGAIMVFAIPQLVQIIYNITNEVNIS